ncbi:TPA: DNA-binding protein [Candidatus Acetothermia bacterium]|nr:DNA-binding protein [Candidatus Acetothermia bacterium]
MNELVREWIEKAEADIRTAEREAVVTDRPNWDAVCLHAQQSVEKYLKAILQQKRIPFHKTHDLSSLAEPLLPTYPEWEALSDSLKRLSLFAAELHYSGEAASKQDAMQAVEAMRQWCSRLREPLGISKGAKKDPAAS